MRSARADGIRSISPLVDLYNAGSIPNLIIGNQGATGTSDGLPSEEYANIFDGPWMAGIWRDQYPDFTPIYARLAQQDSIPAGSVLDADAVFHRGSGEGWASDGDV